MAKPVEFRPIARPAEDDLQRRLDAAPKEHAEAVLNAYRVLQMLHDSQTLDMVRGLLGSGGTVLNEGVSVITSPSSVRSIRNLLIMVELLGELDPELLHSVVERLAPVVKQQPAGPPPSFFSILRSAFSADVRRGMGLSMTVLGALGRGTAKSSESPRG